MLPPRACSQVLLYRLTQSCLFYLMKREIQSLLSGNHSPHLFGCHMYLTVVPSRTMGWVSVLGGSSLQPVVFHFTLPGFAKNGRLCFHFESWLNSYMLSDLQAQRPKGPGSCESTLCVCACVFARRYYSKGGSTLFLISLNRQGF